MSSGASQVRMFWIVTIAAIALRLIHLWSVHGDPLFERLVMDAAFEDIRARGLLADSWPGSEPYVGAPLFPHLLAGLYAVFDGDRLAVRLVLVLVSALGAGLAALTAADLWGRRAGYMAGFLLAALWTHIHFSVELRAATVATTLVLWWIRLLPWTGSGPPRGLRMLAAGLVLGTSAVAVPGVLLVLPVLAWRLGRALPCRAVGLLLLILGLALPIAMTTISNGLRSGDPVPVAGGAGVSFCRGNHPGADGRDVVVPGVGPAWPGTWEDAAAAAERDAGRQLTVPEIDRHYLRRGLAFWAEAPRTAARLYLRKLGLLLGAGERSDDGCIYARRAGSPLLKLPLLAGWAVLLCLAAVGWSRRDAASRARRPLLGVAAAYGAFLLLFTVDAASRLPLAAVLAVPAGAGLDALASAVGARRWTHGRVGPVVAMILLAVSLGDFLGFREHRGDESPFHRIALGDALAARGETEPAVAAYREALSIEDRHPHPHFDLVRDDLYGALGAALLEAGRTAEALQATERWVAAAPNAHAARLRLGNLLLEAGRAEEAEVQFEIVLRSDPGDRGAALGLAWLEVRKGRPGTALRRFQTLHRKRPGTDALFGAATCLEILDRDAEAEAALTEILTMEPQHARARDLLRALEAGGGQSSRR